MSGQCFILMTATEIPYSGTVNRFYGNGFLSVMQSFTDIWTKGMGIMTVYVLCSHILLSGLNVL